MGRGGEKWGREREVKIEGGKRGRAEDGRAREREPSFHFLCVWLSLVYERSSEQAEKRRPLHRTRTVCAPAGRTGRVRAGKDKKGFKTGNRG